MPTRYDLRKLKRYSLEFYGPNGTEDLLWKAESDDPFTPMSRGDRVLPMDAPGARTDTVYEITAVEHLIWTSGDFVRYVTRLYIKVAPPL